MNPELYESVKAALTGRPNLLRRFQAEIHWQDTLLADLAAHLAGAAAGNNTLTPEMASRLLTRLKALQEAA